MNGQESTTYKYGIARSIPVSAESITVLNKSWWWRLKHRLAGCRYYWTINESGQCFHQCACGRRLGAKEYNPTMFTN